MKKKDDFFILKISEDGLRTIIDSLECFSRLGLGQFRYALSGVLSEFDGLSYDEGEEIERYLKHKLNFYHDYGIYHPEVKRFKGAFEIKKEIEKFINLKKSGGVRTDISSKKYDGALFKEEYVPQFLDKNFKVIEDKKEFLVPKKNAVILKKLIKSKNFSEAWELVEKTINFKGIKGDRVEISEDGQKVIVWEPFLLKS